MYELKAVGAMDGAQFGELLKPLTRRDLTTMLIYLHGATPEWVTQALNFMEDPDGTIERLLQAGRVVADALAPVEGARTAVTA
jgi:hypothetical protein